jgi:isopenicillin N synthase-like dioxygenase
MTITPVAFAGDDDLDRFAAQLGASFERYGFAVISDHGVSEALIGQAQAAAKAFFALPEPVKLTYFVPGGGGQRGYTPFGRETAKGATLRDLKEFWHVGRELPPGHPYRAAMPDNLWPPEVEGFRDAVYGLYQALEALGRQILKAVARHLGLDDDWFEPAVRDGNSILRLLHYPPVPADAVGVRAGAHEDINAITLLLGADEAGLELLDRDGRWLAINPPPGTIVCNIGDMLQRLTNHVLPSTTHRVVNPSADRSAMSRYSMPFFLHFAPTFALNPLSSCIMPGRPNRYPDALTADEFLRERLVELGLVKAH